MNDAALSNNMSVQYCMGLAHEMLMALKLPAVTNARASEDNFPTNENRWQIGYTGLLYGAVALRYIFQPLSRRARPRLHFHAQRLTPFPAWLHLVV